MLPTSPLLRLPDELLADIFASVESQDAIPLMRVCKRVKSMARVRAFSTVVVTDQPRFEALAAHIRDIGRHIKLLILNGVPEVDEDEELDDSTAVKLDRVFRRINGLESLTLGKLKVGVYDALLDSGAFPRLKKLKSLTMGVPDDWYDDLPEQWWTAFARCRQLEELTLDGCAYLSTTGVTDETMYTLPAIRRLHLRLDVHGFDVPTDFAVRLPALQALTIDTSEEDIFELCPNLLHNLEPALQCLEVHEFPSYEFDQTPPHLERLTGLRQLFLGEGRVEPEELLKALPALKQLESLTFGLGACASDFLLTSLFKEAPTLPALKRLTLDHVAAARGTTIESQGYEPPSSDEEDEGHMYPGWEAPEWPHGCSEDGVWKVESLADRIGVVVDGTAVDACNWLDDYTNELFDCLMAYGFTHGDFDELVDTFGWALAHDCLLDVNEDWAAEVKRDAIARGKPAFYR